jgi:hypothetical protein
MVYRQLFTDVLRSLLRPPSGCYTRIQTTYILRNYLQIVCIIIIIIIIIIIVVVVVVVGRIAQSV